MSEFFSAQYSHSGLFQGPCLLSKLHSLSCAVDWIIVTILSFTSWSASLHQAKIDLKVSLCGRRLWRDDKMSAGWDDKCLSALFFQRKHQVPTSFFIPERLQAHSLFLLSQQQAANTNSHCCLFPLHNIQMVVVCWGACCTSKGHFSKRGQRGQPPCMRSTHGHHKSKWWPLNKCAFLAHVQLAVVDVKRQAGFIIIQGRFSNMCKWKKKPQIFLNFNHPVFISQAKSQQQPQNLWRKAAVAQCNRGRCFKTNSKQAHHQLRTFAWVVLLSWRSNPCRTGLTCSQTGSSRTSTRGKELIHRKHSQTAAADEVYFMWTSYRKHALKTV